MIEVSMNAAARRAYRKAHQERAQVIAHAWHWLFPASTGR